jgi:hypothetical protein
MILNYVVHFFYFAMCIQRVDNYSFVGTQKLVVICAILVLLQRDINNRECYCSKYPTNDTYSASTAKSTVDRKVYFKRSVRGKWFIISILVQSNI